MWLHLRRASSQRTTNPSQAKRRQTPADVWHSLDSSDALTPTICTGPLANLELPTVEQLAEAIAATISQRINTPQSCNTRNG
eukprot:jgi/Tetstr1/422393/TSEL_013232.t1